MKVSLHVILEADFNGFKLWRQLTKVAVNIVCKYLEVACQEVGFDRRDD